MKQYLSYYYNTYHVISGNQSDGMKQMINNSLKSVPFTFAEVKYCFMVQIKTLFVLLLKK